MRERDRERGGKGRNIKRQGARDGEREERDTERKREGGEKIKRQGERR